LCLPLTPKPRLPPSTSSRLLSSLVSVQLCWGEVCPGWEGGSRSLAVKEDERSCSGWSYLDLKIENKAGLVLGVHPLKTEITCMAAVWEQRCMKRYRWFCGCRLLCFDWGAARGSQTLAHTSSCAWQRPCSNEVGALALSPRGAGVDSSRSRIGPS